MGLRLRYLACLVLTRRSRTRHLFNQRNNTPASAIVMQAASGLGALGVSARVVGDAQLLVQALTDSNCDEQNIGPKRRRRSRSSPVRVAAATRPDDSAGGGAWRAYYSARPPQSPLCLRPLPPLPPTTRFSDVATTTPSFPLPQKKKASQNQRRVRSILRELVACLPTEFVPPAPSEAGITKPNELAKLAEISVLSEAPALPTSSSSSNSSRAREAEVPDKFPLALAPVPPSEPTSLVRPSSAPPAPAPKNCHVAVQALKGEARKRGTLRIEPERRMRECALSSSRVRAADPGRKASVPAAARPRLDAGVEWAGGVRALRDAHVCHVLRQLRHLRHLNAAVDRAAAAAAAAAAANHAPPTTI